MAKLKAVVRGGRAVLLDDRVDYPEGTELELDVVGPDDAELGEEAAERLHASIERGLADVEAGRTRPLEDVIAELRRRG